MKKQILILATTAVITVTGAWLFMKENKKTTLVFATGCQSGMYHKMAQELKDVIEAKNPDLVIQLSPSEGSQENVQMLSNSSAHIALIQNDAKDGASVRSIAAVYPEVQHLHTQTD